MRLIEGKTFYNKPWYGSYKSMLERCYREKSSNYNIYGGRGIKVCDEWDRNYNNFEKWSLENGYADNLSIDRINANGNYEPSNCRWADKHTQDNNKRNSIRVLYGGKYMPIIDVANITGRKYSDIYYLAVSGKVVSKRINVI